MSREFDCMRAFVRHTLENADLFQWSVQGFGMMRTYIGEDKRFRLNLWHHDLEVPGVSIIHDHPWDFTSWIISGRFQNQRYDQGYGVAHICMEIEPGDKGGPTGGRRRVYLSGRPFEEYFPGDRYEQSAEEVHASYYVDGTITVNDRIRRGEDRAHVFWREQFGDWVDAKPRPATPDEVHVYSQQALKGMI